MKLRISSIIYLICISIFGLAAATPAYAAWKLPSVGTLFGFGHNPPPVIRDATDSPKNFNDQRNKFREEVKEKISTPPGLFHNFLPTRAAIVMGNVTAISGTTLTIEKDGKTYSVQTDDKTQFRRRFWGVGSLGEIQVGDLVNVMGKWTDDTQTTILARLVRDVSIQKFMGVFFGTVQSLTSSGWVMTTVGRGNQTVTVTSTTKFTDRKGQTIAQSDIAVGHKVRIRGLWDRKASTITEVTSVKDFSLPVIPTTTPTVAVTATPTP